MQTLNETLDQQIVSRYTGQPSRLPAELRRRIESAWGGLVLLYAIADLGPDLSLTETWCALGATRVAVARRDPVGGEWDIDDFPRRRITAVRESPGLSATTLAFLGAPDEPPLAVVRYTHRQRRAFENLRFVLLFVTLWVWVLFQTIRIADDAIWASRLLERQEAMRVELHRQMDAWRQTQEVRVFDAFQMAEVAVPKDLAEDIRRLIGGLQARANPA